MKEEIKKLQKKASQNNLIEQTYKQAYEKGFIDGSELTGRMAEEEIAELKNKVSKEFDKKHKDPFKQGYEKGYKQGREDEAVDNQKKDLDAYKQGREDIVEELRKEASNLEDRIRESGGSKKEIEDAFDNFYFTLSKLDQ
jgi:flagellar biosynthesis/type III secretory pathway protein FliH